MILVNIVVVCFVEGVNELMLFCIYDKLSEEKLISFKIFICECGLMWNVGLDLIFKDYVILIK